MKRPMRARHLLLTGVALLAIPTAAQAAIFHVSPGQSIQEKIDQASPGDTILVEPGEYRETGNGLYGLRIEIDNLRLIGKKKPFLGDAGKVKLIQNEDQETGIYAAPPDCDYRDTSCPAGQIHDFYVRGFTVVDFPQNGIQTRWVEGFKFLHNESVRNRNNGIYPTLSANGLVAKNSSYGSWDTALWVAGCEDVRVIGNDLSKAPTGLEITVSNEVWAGFNYIHDNTVGVGLYHPNAAGNPPLPVMANWKIEYNYIYDNNLPNPALPNTFQSGLLPGYGVLLLGVSDHVIGKNYIVNNGAAGVAVLGWCTATALGDPRNNCVNRPPIRDPSSNNNRIANNYLVNNGGSPPPIGLPGVDLLYLQTPPPDGPEPGIGNCYEGNFFDTFLSLPGGIDGAPGPLPTDGC